MLAYTVIKKLETKLPQIDMKYRNINYGGCGAFAGLLTEYLVSIGVKCKSVYLSSMNSTRMPVRDAYSILNSNAKLTLTHFNKHDVYCAHVMVCIKINKTNYFIDSTGVYEGDVPPRWQYARKLFKMSPQTVIALGNSTMGWNESFDRSQLPKIKKDLNILFEKFANIK
jgi:hypothetical protein